MGELFMSGKSKGYKYIAIDYLFEGLTLDSDIYDSEGKVTLLAKNTVLTNSQIQRLKQLKGIKQNIRVSAVLHKELLEKGLPKVYEQRYLEEKTGYTQAKTEVAAMLKNIETKGSVSYDEATGLSASLTHKLEQVDPALILQCINGNNEVEEYLYRHSVNVGLLNGLMGKWLDMSPEETSVLVVGGLIHDIGKTKVPQDILNAPRKLTEEEFEMVKKHSTYSYEMLCEDKRFSEMVCNIALYHHEKMNGEGYPSRLVADNIPYLARITSISDIYDAMVSERCYKKAASPFKTLADLAEQKFSDLDVRLVDLFTKMMPLELTGKSVIMSDGEMATVKHVDLGDMKHPYVEINGQIVKTDDEFYCASMIQNKDDVDFGIHLSNLNSSKP